MQQRLNHLLRALAFKALREETTNFVMSLRLSVRPRGTPLLPLDGFLSNYVLGGVLIDLSRKREFAWNQMKITDMLHKDVHLWLFSLVTLPLLLFTKLASVSTVAVLTLVPRLPYLLTLSLTFWFQRLFWSLNLHISVLTFATVYPKVTSIRCLLWIYELARSVPFCWHFLSCCA